MFCSTVSQRRVGPASRARNEKYGPEGGFNPLNFPELPPSLAATICNTANHSITKGTWSSYRTARKMLDECEAKFAGKNFNFPLSEEASIIFCGWLLERGLQAGTIESYFAGLRAFHLANGFSCVSLRTPLINQIINGRKHQPNSEEKGKRMPATPAVLKMIKKNLKSLNRKKKDKLLIWAVCTTAFAGAFRAGELLCKYSSHFDPSVNLMREDVREKQVSVDGKSITILQVKLKSEKTGRPGSSNWVDIYESGNFICPIKAHRKFAKSLCENSFCPHFQLESGKPYTLRLFNSDLKELTANLEGSFSGHSFRIGLASMLGQLGFTDQEIKATGRWSSNAFEVYMRLPRSRRIEMAKKISELSW